MEDNTYIEDEVLNVYFSQILKKYTRVYRRIIFVVFKSDFQKYWEEAKNNADHHPTHFYNYIYNYNKKHGSVSFNEDDITKHPIQVERDNLYNESLLWAEETRIKLFDFQELSKQLKFISYCKREFRSFYGIDRDRLVEFLDYYIDLRNIKWHEGEIDVTGIYEPAKIRKLIDECNDFISLCKAKAFEDKETKDEIVEFDSLCTDIKAAINNRVNIKSFCTSEHANPKKLLNCAADNHKDFSNNYIYKTNTQELRTLYSAYISMLNSRDKENRLEQQIEEAEQTAAIAKLEKEQSEYELDRVQQEKELLGQQAEYERRQKENAIKRLNELKQRSSSSGNNGSSVKDEPSNSGNNSSGGGIGCLIIIIIAIVLIGVFIIRPVVNHSKEKKAEKSSVSASVSLEQEHLTATLADFSDIAHDDSIEIVNKTDTDNHGNTYENNVYSNVPYSMITYNLGGKYDKLAGTWYIAESGKNTELQHYFEIVVDNEVVYTSPSITKGSEPVAFEVDLKFGKAMTITFVSDDSAGIGEAELSCSDRSSIQEKTGNVTVPLWLTSTEPFRMDDEVYITDYSDMSNISSVAINHYITANTIGWDDNGNEIEKPRTVEYVLDGKYSTIKGLWTITQSGKETESKHQFEIYADTELVYTSDIIEAGDKPQPFSADIKNCERLRIVFTKGDDAAAVSSLCLF